MKINEVTVIEARSEMDNFDLTDQQRKVVAIGRQMMDIAAKAKDDTIAMKFSRVGEHMTDWGAAFGPKNMKDLANKSGESEGTIKQLIAFTQKQKPMAQPKYDPKQDKDGDEFAAPSDADTDRKARAFAKGK